MSPITRVLVMRGQFPTCFALAAAPAQYQVSGVKTFMVSHKLRQLRSATPDLAAQGVFPPAQALVARG